MTTFNQRLRFKGMIGVGLLCACTSTPNPPTEALQSAEEAITHAERARVADYASLELSQAREKLAAAQKAVQEKEMVLAERLSKEARVDAELALARATLLKAKATNDETQKNMEILKQEMQRSIGDQP
jgi:Domain of unknown function (DUF4398)